MGCGDSPVEPSQNGCPNLCCISEFGSSWQALHRAYQVIEISKLRSVHMCVALRVTSGWICTPGRTTLQTFIPPCRDTLESSGNQWCMLVQVGWGSFFLIFMPTFVFVCPLQWSWLVLVRARAPGYQLSGHIHLHLGHQVGENVQLLCLSELSHFRPTLFLNANKWAMPFICWK